jgi:hypothetical protein
MHADRYIEIQNTPDYRVFTFVSKGRHGELNKVVSFNEIPGFNNVFNLALGTILPDGTTDFITTTNNGDRNKVLVTVTDIVLKFTERHPGKRVYITGSDNRRTVLYQRAIAYGYDELIRIFNIYGDMTTDSPGNEFELFNATKSYSGFLIERK